MAEQTLPPQTATHGILAAYTDITPCIRGRVAAQLQDEVELEQTPLDDIPPHQTIQTASDDTLVKYPCLLLHAVLQFTTDGQQYLQIECLASGKQLAIASQWDCSIIVCIFRQVPSLAATKLAVMLLSLIRDALLENGLDALRQACHRPKWRIFST
jgi:hypothetical protein